MASGAYSGSVIDPRIERLGELVVSYSLDVREGEILRIDTPVVAAPLALALYKAALKVGARPILATTVPELEEVLLREGSAEQLAFVSPIVARELETIDKAVTIWAQINTRTRTTLNAAPEQARTIALGRSFQHLRDRIAAGEVHWTGVLFPTQAHAQDAGMPLDEYADFVLAACHVHEADPAAHWRSVSAGLAARARQLDGLRELRIVAPDTDLTLSVAGRTWLAADGTQNMPDGEVFTSPVESSVSGDVRFSFPVLVGGREIEGIRLRFEAGRVIAAEARSGEVALRSLLTTDEGAGIVGEVAFGLNPEIDRFTRHGGLDEKIGGTMHLALGRGFAQAGGSNRSAVHTDLVIDLRSGGEVLADGEPIFRNGSFLTEADA